MSALTSVLVEEHATALQVNVCAPLTGPGVPVSSQCASTTVPAMATVTLPQGDASAGRGSKVSGYTVDSVL